MPPARSTLRPVALHLARWALVLAWLSAAPAAANAERALPMRFIAPVGRGAETAYAAAVTGRIVQHLEACFGLPYPFAKLDSMSIPLTSGFSAMEHAGLVTYNAGLLLARPDEQTPRYQRECDYVSVAAHELAHQWFGNLVTPVWWDDLWPLLEAQARSPALREDALAFVAQHHAGLIKRLGRDDAAWLSGVFSSGCSHAEAQQIDAAFAATAATFTGGRQALARTLEAVLLCTAWQAQQGSGL